MPICQSILQCVILILTLQEQETQETQECMCNISGKREIQKLSQNFTEYGMVVKNFDIFQSKGDYCII